MNMNDVFCLCCVFWHVTPLSLQIGIFLFACVSCTELLGATLLTSRVEVGCESTMSGLWRLLCVSRLVSPRKKEGKSESGWSFAPFPIALIVADRGRKMAAVLLLLLSTGALLCSCNAQENNYDRLSDSLKKGVDLALEKLHSHSGIQHHFLFLRTVLKSDIQVDSSVS